MAYASVDDLKAVIPGQDLQLLTDFDGTDQPSDTRLAQALDDAAAEINTWIAKRVDLPLADPPHVLTVICRDLAMHRLYANLGHDSTAMRQLRDGALDILRKIHKGEVALGDDTAGSEEPASPGVAMTDGPDRLLTRDSLTGF
ncbi:hypothetical protein RGUI_0839 [Rhodovulum sp. P5]|uniref:head-tail adaptor n=1 Tax=Rhodovulum phage vB_RhkS_P1 TaxID=1873452 RepID=UPI00080AACE8|nr:DUF1320 domain-containing protein [Rhodovulum sp. P5]YP_009285926.1 head-tail adaptor [Rhodovulum phage vB_RhkS_P1]ANT39912.1 protein of unknown function DUF1320 [Rhodovulum phage vB_RhkS_P1]ARE38980.1 hypothetical protein RGUI_0839 [Rhodovulum sp. P5]